MIMKWTEQLATSVPEIDNQHQEMFKRINKLLHAMHEGKGKDEIHKVMTFLDDYIVTHFNTEENYMIRYNYPELVHHHEQHQGFIAGFSELKKELENEGPSSALVIKTQRKLSDWWTNHIALVDKKLGLFLVQKTEC